MIGFEDACVDAPLGVALLAALEARERGDISWPEELTTSEPVAIDAAIAGRFDRELHESMDRDCQQWWTAAAMTDEPEPAQPLFREYEDVYEDGEFTWAGLWTVTDPPGEVHDELVGAWEITPGPISRWHLPVSDEVSVFEIHRPTDWLELVKAHPLTSSPARGRWEMSLTKRALK